MKDAEEPSASEGLQPKLNDRIMVLRQPWLGYVLDGSKTMELRGRRHRTGHVWLGCSGSIHGRVRILEAVKLDPDEFRRRTSEHLWPVEADAPYLQCWGLLLTDVEPLSTPLSYWRPPSAIGWNLFRRSKDDLPMKTIKAKYIPEKKAVKKRARKEAIADADTQPNADGGGE